MRGSRKLRKVLSQWAVVAVLLSVSAAQAKPSEYQVKAAYLYNFGKFVTWPPGQPSGIFTLCVLGRDPFGTDLDTVIANATIGDRKIVAKRISDVADSGSCQIVFVSTSEASQLDKILPVLAKHHALTVSDMPRFAERNGVIQFVMDSGRVRFEVNQTAAENAGVALSSQLLKVASAIRRTGGGSN